MSKLSATARLIADLQKEKADLERQAALLGDMIRRLGLAQPLKPKKAGKKPASIAERLVSGGEPSL